MFNLRRFYIIIQRLFSIYIWILVPVSYSMSNANFKYVLNHVTKNILTNHVKHSSEKYTNLHILPHKRKINK